MTQKKTAIIFVMNSISSSTVADQIIKLFNKINWQTHSLYFFTSGYLPHDKTLENGPNSLTTLFGRCLGEIPRITQIDYENTGSPDMDLADLSIHNAIVEGFISDENINLESPYYQALRGAALQIRQTLRAITADVILIPGGVEVLSRIAAFQAAELGKKIIYWESAFFDGFINIDRKSQHFFRGLSSIDLEWKQHNVINVNKTKDFIRDYFSNKKSKYSQTSDPNELKKLREFKNKDDRKIIFIPYQVPSDANVISALMGFKNLDEIFKSIVLKINKKEWKIVIKVHPKDNSNEIKFAKDYVENDLLVLREISIYEIFNIADIIITHSSNVGYEGILNRIPVVAIGNPYYSKKGFTTDINVNEFNNKKLNLALKFKPNEKKVLKFTDYLINNYLIPCSDIKSFEIKILDAINNNEYNYNNLAEHYDNNVRKFVERINNSTNLNFKIIEKQLIDKKFQKNIYDDNQINQLTWFQFIQKFNENKKITVINNKKIADRNLFKSNYFSKGLHEVMITDLSEVINTNSAKPQIIVAIDQIEYEYNPKKFIVKLISYIKSDDLIFISFKNKTNETLSFHDEKVHQIGVDYIKRILVEYEKLLSVIFLFKNKDSISYYDRESESVLALIGPTTLISSSNTRILSLLEDPIYPKLTNDLYFHIPITKFWSPLANQNNVSNEFYLNANNKFIIGGPYIKLSERNYVVYYAFELTEYLSREQLECSLIFEVINSENKVMARNIILFQDFILNFSESYFSQEFTCSDSDIIEFRIYLEGFAPSCKVIFKGAYISGREN
jgi:hypothetical protein